jgi:Na+-translocating ferredoxin:NAD+ oxidoreductase RnfG subunit
MAVLTRPNGQGGAAVVAALALVALFVTGAPVGAQVLTQEQALALAFPSVDEIQRRTAYLDEAQLTRIRELAGPQVEVASSVVTYYVGLEDGAPVGVAYFDAHIVRTLDEVLMVVVGSDDRVLRVETVSFREPPEYRAPDGWLDLFDGRALVPELSLRREIPTMTGATLTSVAVTNAVRRVLSLHAVVAPFGARGAGDR